MNNTHNDINDNDGEVLSAEVWKEWEECVQKYVGEIENDFELKAQYLDPGRQEEMDWKERTGLSDDTLKGAIETIIFMSDKPISLMKVRDLIDKEIPLRFLHEALSELQSEYEKSHHGIRLLEVAEGYQFRTKAIYSRYVQKMFKVNSLVLTPSSLEVLAIIAYKQPLSKGDIDRMRGVDSSHIVRTLIDKRLVKISGRSNELGRPTLYGTTMEFLEVFNLADISQLPGEHELEDMATKESSTKISDIRGVIANSDKKKFFYDELDELDELSRSIKSIVTNTRFTKTLNVEEKKRVNETGQIAKSAFEILEEFITQKEISDQNKEANLSDLIMMATQASVVKDLLEGPLNPPSNEEEEDFQMIDLDTGEPIVQEDEKPLSEDEMNNLEEDLLGPDEESYLFTKGEKITLDKKLDEVFDKLQKGETLSSFSAEEEMEFLSEDDLEDKNQEIDDITDQIVEKADEFDLDLDFLRDDREKNAVIEADQDGPV
ncbi:MAG: SMC-Scp complex subunit ScpB [Bacteriovoracaceae bacterium]|nr:SMC-Scp complex subunit ScpB [Bacteriovoracaceae bacterium]